MKQHPSSKKREWIQFTLSLSICLVVLGTFALFAWTDSPNAYYDNWWALDKYLHFLGSLGFSFALYSFSSLFTRRTWLNFLIAFTIPLLVGGGKELLDLAGFGSPSWKDMTWNTLGVVLGLVFAFIFMKEFHARSIFSVNSSKSFKHTLGGWDESRLRHVCKVLLTRK